MALDADFQRDVYCLAGLPFDAVSVAGVVGRIRKAARQRRPLFLSTPNVNFLIGCMGDERFRDSVINSDLSVADGMPLVWIARLLQIPICERVAGSNLFEALRSGSGDRLSVFLFGAPDGVAKAACQRLRIEMSGLTCVGFDSPGFGSVEELSDGAHIAKINASKADFLVVSLGARKGQAWIERNRGRLTVPVISHLGAVANFVAGSVERAPRWMQQSGLEWLWRIKEEPQLWRRYLRDGTALITLLLTRVLPYAWRLWRHRKNDACAASMEVGVEGGSYVVRLSGAWTRQNIAPLRHCFSVAAGIELDMTLEMSGVTWVDSAFVALVMLLRGHRARSSLRLRIVGCRDSIRKILRYCCAEYLVSSDRAT